MFTLRLISTVAALFGTSALLGAALYDAVVLAPNLRGGPTGLEHGRSFLSAATPANLFRILSPATQVLMLAAVVTNWGIPTCRWPLAGALLALVASDVLTLTYHYPRNRLLFEAPLTVSPERLDLAARQWTAANFVRVALVLGSWLATLTALVRYAVLRATSPV
jgi:uncharacterized membrane protein